MPQSSKLPIAALSLRELNELIIKSKGLHEGLYDLAFEFQVAVGAVGPHADELIPGAMIGIKSIGIVESASEGAHTVDAAKVNPLKKPAKKKPSATE
jgi:hypothetical protein